MALLLFLLLFLAPQQQVFAGSATWDANPPGNDWNTAANWTPATVPNNPADTATFDQSTTTAITVSTQTFLDASIFNEGASAYRISTEGLAPMFFEGTGVVNNSTAVQTFVVPEAAGGISFLNGATITGRVRFVVEGASVEGLYPSVEFDDHSSAGSATFFNQAYLGSGRGGSELFANSATAENATFICEGNTGPGVSGQVDFVNSASAGHAKFILQGSGSADSSSIPAFVFFSDGSTADHGRFTVDGATVSGARRSEIDFEKQSTAADGTFILNGSDVPGAPGGGVEFFGARFSGGSAGNATIIVKGGAASGGDCGFGDVTDGGTARIEVFGNGTLTIYAPQLTIGSLEGDATIPLSGVALAIGSNDLSTTFAGVMTDGAFGAGTLTKIGTGALTLSGANIYSNGTQVKAGTLLAANTSGSATGSGAVTVSGGTLGGSGTVAGAVLVGTGSGSGAALAPAAAGKKPATLTTLQSATFQSDGSYLCLLAGRGRKATSDQLAAAGVMINGGAQFVLTDQITSRLRKGTSFTVISNTSADPISGTFANLPDGATISVSGVTFQASYEGGDGNDLTLTLL